MRRYRIIISRVKEPTIRQMNHIFVYAKNKSEAVAKITGYGFFVFDAQLATYQEV